MRRISMLVVGIAGLVSLTGCPPTYPNCNNDEHCAEQKEVCVEGQCRECATSAQCKEGFACETGKCVPKGACQSDNECVFGQKCAKGRCLVPQCDEKLKPCAAGQKCVDYVCLADNALAPGKCNTTEDCGGDQECQKGTCVSKAPAPSCEIAPIRFGFNEAQLSSEARDALSTLAECIKKDKGGGKVRLEGHADERGTEEYNLQLSNRRAASVKKYLGDLGVAGSRLETVGYGENRPAQSGSSEDAWAANRRVEVVK